MDFETAPVPFDWNEHGSRLMMRQRRQTRCSSGTNSVQHVLFVFDSSGSIGQSQYDRMKEAVALLAPQFCREVHFALLTFSSNLNLEFCFNCFSSNYDGKTQAAQAIRAASYQSGSTNTGAAAKCICDHLLHPSCGISVDPSCLDVVFITDGKSNDPSLEVCDEVKCLHNRYGVNTYAIGIRSGSGHNSFDQDELDCISDGSNVLSAFEYNSFDEFEQSIYTILALIATHSTNTHYACARLDGTVD